MRNIEQERVVTSENNSFKFKTLECRYFPSPLHFHPELEVVYINKGDGFCFAADGFVRFQQGDLFFFGGNLSHYFRSDDHYYISNDSSDYCQSTYIQFKESILPADYLHMPGCRQIKELVQEGRFGIKWRASQIPQSIASKIIEMEDLDGFDRLKELYKLLNSLGELVPQGKTIASPMSGLEGVAGDVIYQRVMEYVSLNFKSDIILSDIADYVSMNHAALCRHFKAKAGISIFDYLSRFRIAYAKELLARESSCISLVAYSSGFNTIPNFNVQFKKIAGVTPSQYRASMTDKG
ncbi:MAG: AraC family transcriptional regulator [Rikenellaceae bacterium]